MRKRISRLHERDAQGVLTAGDYEVPQKPEFELGGGGLYSTAPDYLAFIRMILNRGIANGNRVLKPETGERMPRNQQAELRLAPQVTPNSHAPKSCRVVPGGAARWGCVRPCHALGALLRLAHDARDPRRQRPTAWT